METNKIFITPETSAKEENIHSDAMSNENRVSVPVVIMAGGKGTRLYPYTKIIPKPLIPINDISIMERIMDKFMEFGFYKFYGTINYKKELIKAYFKEYEKYHLQFFEEERQLGTAGSLFMIKDHIESTFFVSNCDILLDIDYKKLLTYHVSNKNILTVVTASKRFEISYGVVSIDDKGKILHINEKPQYDFLVTTGMYVMEPEILRHTSPNSYLDMPELIKICLNNNDSVGVYTVEESSWLDMGDMKAMGKIMG